VSENPNSGPLTAQMISMAQQARKVTGMPAAWATALATLEKALLNFIFGKAMIVRRDSRAFCSQTESAGVAQMRLRKPRWSSGQRVR